MATREHRINNKHDNENESNIYIPSSPSVPKFFSLKQESMKQQHAKNQHPSKQPPPKLIDGKPIPDTPPLYHVKYRTEIRLNRYLNQHHQFICALEPCFTTIVPFLTIDDLVRLSSVCGILNNWVLAEVVKSINNIYIYIFVCEYA